MTSLLSDDHLVNIIGLMAKRKPAIRRAHPAIAKRTALIGDIFYASDISRNLKVAAFVTRALSHYDTESLYTSITGEYARLAPNNELLGNYGVWRLFRAVVFGRDQIKRGDKPLVRRMKALYENSLISVNYRSGEGTLKGSALMHRYASLGDDLTALKIVESHISEKVKSAHQRFNKLFSSWKATGFAKDAIPKQSFLQSEARHFISILSFGRFLMVRVGAEIIFLSAEHMKKFNALLKAWNNILFMLPTTSARMGPMDFLEEYLEEAWVVISEDVDFLGEVLKGARTVLISSLDQSKILGIDMGREATRALAPDRRDYAIPLISFAKYAFASQLDAINIMNTYKAIPHPDTNLHLCFTSISGLADPNRVNRDLLPRFRGTLRRALYRSLAYSKHDVRMEATSPAGASLATQANLTQRSVPKLCEMSTSAWASVRFHPVRSLPKPLEMDIAPSDKSSQLAPDFTTDDLVDSLAWANGDGSDRIPDFLASAKTVNDASSFLKGNPDWNIKDAINRFERVVRAHEAFERRFGTIDPEDIPEIALKEFVENTPEARYLVGTEPKLGEYHKKVTRMFYMGEQQLKIITQLTERLARQVSRKQMGVSIVKGYGARRKDLESFAASVAGVDSDRPSIFTSFDMSEFSKKFPMPLVREYGETLAELTGETWLRRLDLVFRSAVVVHNTRGYFNFLSGVKGGFEGFLNFVWSSIHAVVMEIALNATGLTGALLVYSDDGVMLFYPPAGNTPEQNRDLILRIQRVYADYGLTFHLGKTLVSTHVWEYLGDVCYNGKLIPMWMKEVSGAGILKSDRGLSPLRMRVSAFEGQIASAIGAGASPIAASILLRFISGDYLSNFLLSDNNRLIEALLITPVALGGMRIRSPAELCLNSDIPVLSEFAADLEGLLRLDSDLFRKIVSGVAKFTNGVTPTASRLFMGNLVSSNLPDTSGMGVNMKAVEAIIDNIDPSYASRLGEHPIKGPVENELQSVLRSASNINVRLLSSLLMAVPAWIAFGRSMALVRGSGAIRLIKRAKLKMLQSEDTTNCLAAFGAWREHITYGEDLKISGGVIDFINDVCRRVNRGFDIRPLKESGRSLLRLAETPAQNNVEVRYHPGSQAYPADLEYKEPSVRFPKDNTSLSWYSEATGDIAVSAARRFLNVCASFLSYSPESSDFLQYLGSVFGVHVPLLLPGLVAGFQRRAAHTSSDVDVRVVMPRHFWSLSRVVTTGPLNAQLRAMDRADRVTYLEYGRVLASFASSNKSATGNAPTDAVIPYYFNTNLERYLFSCHNPIMVANEIPYTMKDTKQLDPRMVAEFQATISENINAAEQQRIIDVAAWDPDLAGADDLLAVLSISINSLARWIHDFIMVRSSVVLPVKTMPIPPAIQSTVIKKAIQGAMWMSLDPHVRGTVANSIGSLNEVLTSPLGVMLSPAKRALWSAARVVRGRIDHIVNTLKELDHPVVTPHEIDAVVPDLQDTANIIAECVLSSSIFSEDQTLVMLSSDVHANYMSEAHRAAYRGMFSATISALMSHIRDDSWTGKILPIIQAMRVNPDDLLDWLIVCRPLLRASTHRTIQHPYNRKSAIIEMYKFYSCLQLCEDQFVTVGDAARVFVTNFRLRGQKKLRIQRSIGAMSREGIVGPDHAALIDGPLNPESVNRLLAHCREAGRGRRYGTAPVHNPFQLIQWINASLTAYFNAVLVRMIDKVVEIPSSMFATTSQVPAMTALAYSQMAEIRVNMQFLSGVDVPDEEIARSEPMKSLLSAHIESYCIKAGLSGLQEGPGLPIWSTMLLVNSGYYNPEGPRLVRSNFGGDDTIGIIRKQFRTAKAAFATFVTIARVGLYSLSLLRDSSNGAYYLFGVHTNIRLDHYPEAHEGLAVTEEAGIPLTDMIPNSTISNTTAQVRRALGPMTRSDNPLDRIDDFHYAVNEFARQNRRPAEVNDFSVYLQAAAELAKDASTDRDKVWSYVLFMHYRNSMEVLDNAQNSYNRLRAVLNGPESVRRTNLILDISNVVTWLQFILIHTGGNITHGPIVTLIESAPAGGIRAEIRPSITFHRFKTISEIESERSMVANRINPGDIAGSLIIVETRAILPGEPEVEEGDEINPDDVDLDEFF